MPTTVDSLDIQISAESKKASVAIDNLVKKLDRVSASLSGVNTRGLATMASGVNKLSNAMANFSKNTKTADFSRITRNLNKLGEINPNSIAVASKSLGKIAGAMKAFDSINVGDNAAKLAELSKGISTLGYKSAEKALENIPKLATAMKSFMKTLSTAPKVSQNIIDMTNAMARFARTGSSGGKAANELANSMSNMSRKFASIPSVFKKVNVTMSSSVLSLKNLKQALFSVIGTFGGIHAVFEGLKKSIDISSDLTEVQNVVDVAFGKYKKSIEDFSKISIKDFGMSELTAKTMAGRFQAMGTAIGFSQKKMSGMSVELTKLAADMASFYNVEQDDVAKSLQSVFTGETEPLRKYGLDLTQVTLEEWAHKQGIDAKMKSMSQAEKTMLRYQYVMANTGAAQGDFARTANTWANQVRVLKQNFEVLGSTVGGVLINALKPFVQGLNVIMVQINDFAKIISNALGKIFGWTYEEGGGATNPAEEMSSGMDDVADSTDNATKAQKEYNRQLGKFDELNNYNKQKNNDTNGGDGTGNGITMPSSAGTSTGKWTQGKSILKEYESEIDSLYELGATIGDTLKKAMERIDWDGIYAKAGNFGTGLANFLNGLISPDLFNELGETVAGTLNTALHFLDSFGNTFEWENFGISLSEGLKGFFGTFDWKLATDTFNTLTNGILDSIIAGLENIGKDDWKKVGQTIADMISGIDVKGITFKVGKIANELANAFYLLVSNKDTWKNLGTKIADGINGFFDGMNEVDKKTGLTGWQALGKSISDTIIGFGTTITTALDNVRWEDVGQAIADFITSIDWGGVVWTLGNVVESFATSLKDILKGGGMNDTLANLVVNVGIGGWIIKKLSKTKLGKAISKKLGSKFSTTLKKVGASIKDWIVNSWNKSKLKSKIENKISGIKTSIKNAGASVKNWVIDKWNESALKAKLSEKVQGISTTIKNAVASVKKWIVDAASKLKAKLAIQGSVPGTVNKPMVNISIGKFKTTGKIPNLSIPSLTGTVKSLTIKTEKGTSLISKIKNALGITGKALNLGNIVASATVALGAINPGPVADDIARNLDEKVLTPLIEKTFGSVPGYDKEAGVFSIPKQIFVDFPIAIGSFVFNDEEGATKKTLQEAFNKFMTGGEGGTPSIKALVKYITDNESVEEVNKKIPDSKTVTATFKAKVISRNDWLEIYKKFNSTNSKDVLATFKAKTGNDWTDKYRKYINLANKTTEWKLKALYANEASKALFNNPLLSSKGKNSILKKTMEVDVKLLLNSKNAADKLTGHALESIFGIKKASGGIFSGGSWHNIAKYAGGGLPGMGQMFIAREKGPELVGNLGGHTAVMNNDQIVSSVSDGVYRAVLAAMSNFSYNNRTSQGDIVVQIDGKEVFRAVRNEDIDFKRRTGKSAFS